MKHLLVNSVDKVDWVVWLLVIAFFCGSAIMFSGNVQLSVVGAGGIILEMLLIGVSIEIIIDRLQNIRCLGTITGFITNGPEMLCLIVGLVVGDVLFAASTPLGSNIMNPILLFIATIITRKLAQTLSTYPKYMAVTIGLTAVTAVSFFAIQPNHYFLWASIAFGLTVVLFLKRPAEQNVTNEGNGEPVKIWWLIMAIAVMTGAGYFLDPVVSFAAEQSHAPKGVIGFFVLATLTSWPELKSTLALLSRNKILAAVLNITVSNITNIWLAVGGVLVYCFTIK